jgi:hypothetical protein
VVLGVLLAEDGLVLVCPAMLLDGAEEAFSEVVGLVDAEALALGVLLAVD